jgi:phosphohistidine swiveling domain-containing protein
MATRNIVASPAIGDNGRESVTIVYATSRLRTLPRVRIGAVAYQLGLVAPPFSILPGVCLTTRAYMRHLRHASVTSDIDKVDATDVAAIQRLSARVTSAIFDCPLERDIAAVLHARGRTWPACRVQVSGPDSEALVQVAEAIDPGRSVQAGWASVWHPARLRDRLAVGMRIVPTPVALLVQLIPKVQLSGWARPGPKPNAWTLTATQGWPWSGHDAELPPPVEKRLRTKLAALGQLFIEIEWVLSGNRIYAVTVLPARRAELRGVAASPGTASGPARLVNSPRDGLRLEAGSVLVSRTLDPALTAYVPRAAAIIVESGGRTSHLAIVARQFGVPAVLGVQGVTDWLRDGQQVTVDGSQGRIYIDPSAVKRRSRRGGR